MKQNFSVVFVLCFLMICIPDNAEAQFWKKLFKKRKSPKQEESNTKKPAATAEPSKKRVFTYPATRLKTNYRVDLLLPLYLGEIVQDSNHNLNSKVPEKASAGIDFYKGVKIAADSLNKLRQHLNIYVHDISDTFRTLDFLVNTHEFDASDLIIGAIQSRDIPLIANYAERNHINFISVFSPSDGGVSYNPYFTMLQPSLQGHCEWIKESLIKHYPKRKILLFYRQSVSVDQSAYDYMTSGQGIMFRKLAVDTEPDSTKLKPLFDSIQTNVIIMPVLDQEYAEKLLKILNRYFPGYQFDIYGMPSWKSISSLRKKEAYPNIRVNITQPFYFDFSTKSAHYVEKAYRKEFGGKAGEMVFRGYETLFWYADILKKYGNIYNTKIGDNSGAPFTKFQIRSRLDNNKDIMYNENRQIYLYRYQKGALHVEQ